MITVDVVGASMLPALQPGDRLLCERGRAVRMRAIVVRVAPTEASDAYHIKRVVALPATPGAHHLAPGFCWLEGDAAGSVDSRDYGPVPLTEILAVALARVRPDGLADVR